MARRRLIVTGVVLDEAVNFGLGEICRSCGVSAEAVIEMVEEGVLEPAGSDPMSWRFEGPALRRLQTALRLRRDLRVNLAGAALALDLMEELESLRRQRPWLARWEQGDAEESGD